MGWRFRRSVRLFGGLRVNLSKTGPSLTLHEGPVSLTVGHGRVRRTLGLHGTGISYTESMKIAPLRVAPASQTPTGSSGVVLAVIVVGAIMLAVALVAL